MQGKHCLPPPTQDWEPSERAGSFSRTSFPRITGPKRKLRSTRKVLISLRLFHPRALSIQTFCALHRTLPETPQRQPTSFSFFLSPWLQYFLFFFLFNCSAVLLMPISCLLSKTGISISGPIAHSPLKSTLHPPCKHFPWQLVFLP